MDNNLDLSYHADVLILLKAVLLAGGDNANYCIDNSVLDQAMNSELQMEQHPNYLLLKATSAQAELADALVEATGGKIPTPKSLRTAIRTAFGYDI